MDDARRLLLDRRRFVGLDRALAVHRLAERVDDAAKQGFANRHFENTAGGLYRVAFRNVLVVTEDNRADRVVLEVQREAERVAGEFEHLAVAGIGEAVNTRNTVRYGNDRTDVARFRSRIEILDSFLNQITDLRRFK